MVARGRKGPPVADPALPRVVREGCMRRLFTLIALFGFGLLFMGIAAMQSLSGHSGEASPKSPETARVCFTYSGPTTPAEGLAALFAPEVTAVHKMNFPAGNFTSWFRGGPGLATLASIESGDALCAAGPADDANLFAVDTGATTAAAPPPETAPPALTTASTETGMNCFVYAGPTTNVSDFGARFSGAVTAVQRWNLPDGKFSSWFASNPGLSTIVSLGAGDVVCVSAPPDTSVFR
jgi:hypothetical protein